MSAREQWARAEAARTQGRIEDALAGYRELLGVPEMAPYAHARLSELAQAAGDLRRGTAHVLAIDTGRLREPSLLALTARQCLALGEAQAGLAAVSALLDAPSAPAALLAETAKLLSDHMEPNAALALLARAREAGLRESAGSAYLDGLNRTYVGALDAARASLERSLALDADFAPAYWSLAKLAIAEGRGMRVDALQRRVAAMPDDHPDAPLLLYSLFHELDAGDDRDAAWAALERAMRARRRQVRFSDAQDDALFARLAAGSMALADAFRRDDGAEAEPKPLMLVGMPRTGTTIIEQSVCTRYRAASAGELRDFVQQMRWVANRAGPLHPDIELLDALDGDGLAMVGQRYRTHAAWRAGGEPAFIDKWPENYLVLGHALAAMDDLRAVVVLRDPMDACWSNLKEWFGGSYYYSYDLGEVARRHARFARHVRMLQDLHGGRIVAVDYEAFVGDHRGETARIGASLGLQARERPASGGAVVATASAVQVRNGVSSRSVGAWKRYARQLEPLRQALLDAGVDEDACA